MGSISRRSFLKSTGTLAVCAAGARLRARSLRLPIGLQLYSVRNELPKDFAGTLAQVQSAGYGVVEAAGFYDRTAGEFRHAMDSARLRCVSAHYSLSVLETQLDQSISYCQALGLEYIVCSSSDGMHRDPAAKGPKTLDDWRWIASEFNRVGERVNAAGMTFGVHNHTPEFAVIDGLLIYDELLRLTDPKLVFFEMDCGWVYAAGHNPADYLTREPQRFPLLHVKDMVTGANGQMHSTEMGRGVAHYAEVMRAARGMKYYFIEQEEFDMDPMEALGIDAKYMEQLRV